MKLKLNRQGLKIASVLIAGVTFLTSCGSLNQSLSNQGNIGNYDYSSGYSYGGYSEDNAITEGKINFTDEEIKTIKAGLSTMVSISNLNLEEFNSYLSSIDETYAYEDLFGIDEALNLYYKQGPSKVTKHTGDFIGKDNKFTFDEIYSSVLNNNKKYQEESRISFYKELDDSQLRAACEIITNVLNDYLSKGLVQDVSELSCILSNLKVLKDTTSLSNAYVTDDDCLAISPSMLEIMDFMAGRESFEQTVTHEVEHLLQKSCQDELKEDSKTIGICTKYNNLKVNPLFFDWFYEASAEKETCNYMNTDPIVYNNMIGYLESVALSTILYKDVKVNQTERLSTQKDLNKLFEQFHCKTEEDKKNVIKMMFAIDILQNDDKEFVNLYQNTYGVSLTTPELDEIKFELKPYICTTYLKSFYRSLGEVIKDKSIPLSDVFYLIRLAEADINNHILYNESSKYEYNKDFIKQAASMQEEFFKSINTGYTVSELSEMYQNYQNSLVNENEILNWLDSGKKEYLTERANYLDDYSKVGMMQVYEAQKGNQKTK